jgi:sec-independent protein translocase protein TatA
MGIGFRELLVILLIALLIFGGKKLRTIGTDLGAAVRGFKKSMDTGEKATWPTTSSPSTATSDTASAPAARSASTMAASVCWLYGMFANAARVTARMAAASRSSSSRITKAGMDEPFASAATDRCALSGGLASR